MARLGTAYWKLHYSPKGISVEVWVKGKAFLFPAVDPRELGMQIAVIRDLLFACDPQAEFSIYDWSMQDR